MVKDPPAMQQTQVQSLGGKDPLEGGHGHPLQYSCLENHHGQRSLAGYSPRGHKESDTTERPNSNNNPNSITTLEVGYSAEPWSSYGTELQFLRLKN